MRPPPAAGRRPQRSRSGRTRSASSPTPRTTPCTSPTTARPAGQHDRLDAQQRHMQRDRSRRLPGHASRRPSTSSSPPDDVDVQGTHTVYVTDGSGPATRSNSVVGVRREHLQRDHAIRVRPARHAARRLPGPNAAQIDPANRHLIHGQLRQHDLGVRPASCNAGDLAGCATVTPGTVTLPAPGFEHRAVGRR